jgi:phage shock protein A
VDAALIAALATLLAAGISALGAIALRRTQQPSDTLAELHELVEQVQEERDLVKRDLRETTNEVVALRREVHRLTALLLAAGILPGDRG